MKRLVPTTLFGLPSYCVFILSFFILLSTSCTRVNDDVDLTLDFPKKFVLTELIDRNTQLYRRNEDGSLPELTRDQAGTFTGFIDSMTAYTELSKTQLNFTGIEFLDASKVRIFSDGSLGIPAFDTIVGYSQTGQDVIKIITVDWVLLNAPLILTLGNINGQYLSLTPVWFYHTYTLFMPPFKLKYSPLQLIYSSHYGVLHDLVDFLQTDVDYGNYLDKGDTLALHWGSLHFK